MTCKTVKQTAKYFGVTPPTVYKWTREGELGYVRLPGGSIRIRINDIEEFEARQWHAPESNNPSTDLSNDVQTESITFIGQKADDPDPKLHGRQHARMRRHTSTDGK